MCLRFVCEDSLVWNPRFVITDDLDFSSHRVLFGAVIWQFSDRAYMQTGLTARRLMMAANLNRDRSYGTPARGRTAVHFSRRLRASGTDDRVAARRERRIPSPRYPTVLIFVDGDNPIFTYRRVLLARVCELYAFSPMFCGKEVAGCSSCLPL